MKKTYIVPENTVVLLNAENMVCTSGPGLRSTSAKTDSAPSDINEYMEEGTHTLGRENINTPDIWEEW